MKENIITRFVYQKDICRLNNVFIGEIIQRGKNTNIGYNSAPRKC